MLVAASAVIAIAQTSPGTSSPEDRRIFGIIPNYLTVSNPQQRIEPLSFKEKLELFARQTYDPFTMAAAAAAAGLSQASNGDPKYGQGGGAYGQRFGAAMADLSTQSFFSGVLLAHAFHEDPRYFRRGPEYSFWNRLGYSLTRTVVTRTDSGTKTFNYAGMFGMAMGIGLSNAYYPDASVNARETASRFGTSLLGASLANILPEFWPDIRSRFLHHKHSPATPPGQVN